MGKRQQLVVWVSPREVTDDEVTEGEVTVNHGLGKQCFAAFAVSLTALNCGLATRWIAPISVEFTAGANIVGKFTDNVLNFEILTSLYAAVLSALLMGLVATLYGRKPALYLTAIINIIGGVILRIATDSTAIWAGNACASCTIISGLVLGPMLLSEICHKNVRGALIMFCTLQYNLGMLVAYSVRSTCSAENIFYIIYIVLPAVQIILYIFIPESPFFLVSKLRILEAEESLFWSRGSNRPIAKRELAILVRSLLTNKHDTFLHIIKRRSTRNAFLTSTGLVLFQRMSGFLVFSCYSCRFIFAAGDILSMNHTGVVLAGAQIAISFITLCAVDFVGRKFLLYVSYGGTFLALLTMLVYWVIKESDPVGYLVHWLPLACMLSFTVFYNMGAASMTTLIPYEVTPIKVKGVIASIDVILTSLIVLAVAGYNPLLEEHVGDYMNFLIPTIMNAIALVFIWAIVPETKGISLLEYSEKTKVGPCDCEPLKNETSHL